MLWTFIVYFLQYREILTQILLLYKLYKMHLSSEFFTVCFRMIALLKRFRLDFNDVIVMTDSEKHPHSKKYVDKTLTFTLKLQAEN